MDLADDVLHRLDLQWVVALLSALSLSLAILLLAGCTSTALPSLARRLKSRAVALDWALWPVTPLTATASVHLQRAGVNSRPRRWR
jgi:hypothetical protein